MPRDYSDEEWNQTVVAYRERLASMGLSTFLFEICEVVGAARALGPMPLGIAEALQDAFQERLGPSLQMLHSDTVA